MVRETKLYDTLGISPEASLDDIKKAYRKCALKYHPDRNEGRAEATEKFKEVSQAFEILSNPEHRKIYDQYGLDFLLRGGSAAPPPGSGPGAGGFPGFNRADSFPGFQPSTGVGGGPRFTFTTSGRGGGGFGFSSAENIFANFAKMGGFDGDEDFSRFFGGDIPLGGGGGARSFANSSASSGFAPRSNGEKKPSPEVTVVEKPITFTLEELFHGAKKKFKVKRKTFDREGRIQREDKDLEISVKPGMKSGSKFKFKGVGDEIDGTKQDIHFVIGEKPHPLYERKGDDLIVKVSLPLKEALTGWSRIIKTIDGKQIKVSHTGPTPPTWSQTFPSLGMVLPKDPTQRGDLIIKVAIIFPTSLTPEQKAQLSNILP